MDKVEFVKEESPLQYGIMFSESAQQFAETRWYVSEEARDLAISDLLETGSLDVGDLSQFVRTIKPIYFATVDASKMYYKRV